MKIYFVYRFHTDHTRIGYDYVELKTYLGECPSYARMLDNEVREAEISDTFTKEEADFICNKAHGYLGSNSLEDIDGAIKYAIEELEKKKASK